MKKHILTLFLLIFFIKSNAQYYTYDVGFFTGISSLESDYYAPEDISGRFGNSALSLSFVHYTHFFNKSEYWNSGSNFVDRIMLKSELNLILNKELKHFGSNTLGNGNSARELRGMNGSLTLIQLGVGGEYYLHALKDFIYPNSRIRFNPFITLGLTLSIYSNTLDYNPEGLTSPGIYNKSVYPNNTNVGSGPAASIYFGFGTRYKLNNKFDLSLEATTDYFLTDAIDGLHPEVPGNKFNDYILRLRFGIIYHLNFDSPVW